MPSPTLLLWLLLAVAANAEEVETMASMSMNTIEKETLFSIMEEMSSDRRWRLSEPNPCMSSAAWPGLECKPGPDNHLHVSRLDFGVFPNPTCKRTAKFPSLLFSLPYLQSIFFFNCFTHTKTAISIPSSSSNRPSLLQQLSLRTNPALVGRIPSQISSLKSLQVLTLSQNKLEGTVPTEITTLTSLIHLDLSYNSLTGILPLQLGNLINLIGLDLSFNSFNGAIPESVGQLGMLQKLDFTSNLLSGFIPNTMGDLHSLVFLALSNNKLVGYSPASLEKLQNLQYFIMDNNGMSSMTLPSELGKLVKLQELRLESSGYMGTIPLSFSSLQNLTSLSLQNNQLTGQIPAGLSSLSHIYHLNLSRNMLSGAVPFNATFVGRLGRNLDLSGNPGLCLNESKGFENSKIYGIGLCGSNMSTASLIHQPRSSSQVALGDSFVLTTLSSLLFFALLL